MSVFRPITRDYEKVDWTPPPERPVDAVKQKLLPGDIISLDGAVLETSPMRRPLGFASVALFDGSTLGRDTETGLMCYKVVPFESGAPIFRMPIRLARGVPRRPTYVRVVFQRWDSDCRRPMCRCLERIGVVDSLDAYMSFRLLAAGLRFSTAAHRRLMHDAATHTLVESACAGREQDRGAAIAVDPVGSKDFDDAIGASATDRVISVYVADVPALLDAIPGGRQYVPDQTASIYLPGRTLPMLPRILADELGSLVAGAIRPAWRFNLTLDEHGRIERFEHVRVAMKVTANYTYDTVRGGLWSRISELAQLLNYGYGWYDDSEMADSHNVIACCMLAVNHAAGVLLRSSGSGLLRVCSEKEGASYVRGNTAGDVVHEPLRIGAYAHVTSPLRRLADVANLKCLAGEECEKLIEAALRDQGRAIGRVESDVALLHMVQNNSCNTTATVISRQGPDTDGLYDYRLVVPGYRVRVQIRSQERVDINVARTITLVRIHGEYEWGRQISAAWAPTQTCSLQRR